MRLDHYLRASRLIARRTVAQQLCEAGKIRVGDAVARSSHTIKVGDVITIQKHERSIVVRVSALPSTKQVAKTEAANLYETISETPIETDSLNPE